MKLFYIVSTLERTGPIVFLFNLISKIYFENEITIITLAKEKSFSMYEKFESLNISIINIGENRFNIFNLYSNLIKIVSTKKPDIIHSNGFRADFFARLLILKGFKCISTLHNFPFEDYPKLYGFLKGYLLSLMHFFVLKGFKKLISCSEYIELKFRKLNFNNVFTIRNGVDTDTFFPLSKIEKTKLKLKLELPNNSKIITFVGPIIERKRIINAVKALNRIIDKTDFYFIIIGDGILRNKLLKSILSNRIIYIGFKENVHEYLKVSDIYLSFSSSEGLPIGAIEALCCGNHLILSNIGPHLELYKLYKNHINIINGFIDSKFSKLLKSNKPDKKIITNNFDVLSSFQMAKSYYNFYHGFIQ